MEVKRKLILSPFPVLLQKNKMLLQDFFLHFRPQIDFGGIRLLSDLCFKINCIIEVELQRLLMKIKKQFQQSD